VSRSSRHLLLSFLNSLIHLCNRLISSLAFLYRAGSRAVSMAGSRVVSRSNSLRGGPLTAALEAAAAEAVAAAAAQAVAEAVEATSPEPGVWADGRRRVLVEARALLAWRRGTAGQRDFGVGGQGLMVHTELTPMVPYRDGTYRVARRTQSGRQSGSGVWVAGVTPALRSPVFLPLQRVRTAQRQLQAAPMRPCWTPLPCCRCLCSALFVFVLSVRHCLGATVRDMVAPLLPSGHIASSPAGPRHIAVTCACACVCMCDLGRASSATRLHRSSGWRLAGRRSSLSTSARPQRRWPTSNARCVTWGVTSVRCDKNEMCVGH
jgi:hypothetical protein